MNKPKLSYYNNGKVSYERYFLNDQLHRIDGPAVISYYDNGKVEYERYYLNGETHRTDGPAVISYYTDGKVGYEEYYLNGKIATKEQIQEIKFNKQFTTDLEEVLSE